MKTPAQKILTYPLSLYAVLVRAGQDRGRRIDGLAPATQRIEPARGAS